jgi:hypothetical protein
MASVQGCLPPQARSCCASCHALKKGRLETGGPVCRSPTGNGLDSWAPGATLVLPRGEWLAERARRERRHDDTAERGGRG